MPIDEAVGNGHRAVVDLLKEAVRKWEVEEIDDDFKTNIEECAANDNVICTGVDLTSNATSKLKSNNK